MVFWIIFFFSEILEMPVSFMNEVYDFSRQMYLSGQNDLDKRGKGPRETEKRTDFHTYEMMVLSCAACIDLMFWAVKEERGKFWLIQQVELGSVHSRFWLIQQRGGVKITPPTLSCPVFLWGPISSGYSATVPFQIFSKFSQNCLKNSPIQIKKKNI